MTHRIGRTLIVLGVLAIGSSAAAEERGAIELGLHLGYMVPFGQDGRVQGDTTDEDLSQAAKDAIPIGLDAGFVVASRLYLGLTVQYAFAFLPSNSRRACDALALDCSASDTRLGLNVQYRLAPESTKFRPWVGLGFGYEWFHSSVATGTGTLSATASGFELVSLQLGGDFATPAALVIGPYASLSFGRFRSVSNDNGTTTQTRDVTDQSFHEWLMFGIRGAYRIGL